LRGRAPQTGGTRLRFKPAGRFLAFAEGKR
jgi:hypothetical protein